MSRYRDAVGVMIINQDKKLFLAYRAWTQHSKYHWQMPQGGIDTGETAEAAAWREMYEETGLTPENTTLIKVSDNWYTYDLPDKKNRTIDGERQKWFLMLFKGKRQDINLKIQKHPEFVRYRWADPRKAPYLIIPFKKQVYEQVLAEFLPVVEKLEI